jgi:hypothetical protein
MSEHTQELSAQGGAIVDTMLFCSSFPEKPPREIARENVLHTFSTIFDGETQMLIVEGPEKLEGIGKTTVLAQFARRNHRRTISIFIRPTSWFAYDPGIILKDLCSQIHWVTFGREISSDTFVDDGLLANLIYELQRFCKRTQQTSVFVIDGITDIPEDRLQIRDAILSKLPFGLPQFRFLLSGDFDEISKLKIPAISRKSYTLSAFSLDETISYFGDLIPREVISEIFKISHGVPAYLGRIRQLVESALAPEQLLERLPTTMPELFAIEWQAMERATPLQEQIVALLAHDRNKHTMTQLGTLFQITADDIRQALKSFSFLSVPSDSLREVEFVSDTYRRYAGERLRHLRGAVNEIVIDSLLRDPESEQSLSLLPVYLEDAGRDEALLSYLSPEHFGLMLEKSQLVNPVQERARIGVETALRLKRDEELARLSLLASVLSGIEGFTVSRPEIEARLALGDVRACITLAQAAVLKEDRIQLLALVARKIREKGLPPEAELLEQIDQLGKEVSFSTFTKPRAVELAGDLIYSRPELALVVLDKAASNKGSRKSPNLDWILARMSLQAAFSEETELKSAAETFKNRIKDPDVLRFSVAMSFLLGPYTASQIIDEVDKIKNPQNKLSLLRQWALHVTDDSSIAPIIEYTLDLGIKTTQYSPNATHLRELATPLPQIKDADAIKKLVAIFDSQKATVENVGPTEEFVRLQLTLAEAEAKHDIEASIRRLEETYLTISYITDLATKTACIARLTGTLRVVDPSENLDSKNLLHSMSKADLHSDLTRLLQETAQHFTAVKKVIDALVSTGPSVALGICLSLNTETRRDQALRALIKSSLRLKARKIDFAVLEKVLDSFADSAEHDAALSEILERVALILSNEVFNPIFPAVIPFCWRVKGISKAELRTKASCFALQVTRRGSPGDQALNNSLEATLRSSWDAMDEDWRKVEAAFQITSVLSVHYKSLAEEYLSKAQILRGTVALENGHFNFGVSLRLASRAYGALLGSKLDSDNAFATLEHNIDRLPSLTSRLELWVDVALRSIANDKLADSSRIVEQKLRPYLAELEQRDYGEWCNYFSQCAPVLFTAHAKSTLEIIATLPGSWRDIASNETIEFICRKVPSTDPYQAMSSAWYRMKYTDISDIIDLLENINSDYLFHESFSNLVNSVRKQKPPFSQQQKASAAQRLNDLISGKLPSKNGIQHEGWVIACKAELLKLQRSKEPEWDALICRLGAIPNTADRAYTTALVAGNIWSTDPILGSKLFKEAETVADSIPSLLHKVDMYSSIADFASVVDPEYSKGCLTRAAEMTLGHNDADFVDTQRDLVDLANTISSEFGSHLATIIDKDPARANDRARAKRQLELLDFRKKMLDESVQASELFSLNADRIPQSAWDNLGALNANRVEPVPLRHAREYMRIAAKLPMSEAYPIFCWSIENSSRKSMLGPKEQAQTYLPGLFRATVQASELCAWMAGKFSGRVLQNVKPITAAENIAGVGTREAALTRIREWLQSHANEYLKITDQFVGPDEAVEIMRMVLSTSPKLRLYIVTSRQHQLSSQISQPWEESFRLKWRLSSDQEAPDTRIIVAGLRNGDSPIHDRWWITRGAGLRLGTSFNSIGTTKDSELTQISSKELPEFEADIDTCISLEKRGRNAEKVTYSSFTV